MSMTKFAASTAAVIVRKIALHQRVVEAGDRPEELVAESGVGEDDLGEQCSADDEADRHADRGHRGKSRVAGGVAEHDPRRGAGPSPRPSRCSPRSWWRSWCCACRASSRRWRRGRSCGTGSTRWTATSEMNSAENAGVRPAVKACRNGNQPSVTPNRYSAPMASKKYGNDPTKTRQGWKVESRKPPRRQAARMPEQVAQDDRDDQGGAPEKQGPPDLAGDDVGDRSGEPGDRHTQVAGEDAVPVAEVLLPDRRSSSPNSCRSCATCSGVIRPCDWLIIREIGSPGMKRGKRKFRVTETQNATR